jgi:hypothetical protein
LTVPALGHGLIATTKTNFRNAKTVIGDFMFFDDFSYHFSQAELEIIIFPVENDNMSSLFGPFCQFSKKQKARINHSL